MNYENINKNTVILLSKAKQSKAKQLLYILTNNYFKFIFQKIFFAMRCLTLCAFGSGVNLVKSFLTLIKFNFNRIFKIYYKEI